MEFAIPLDVPVETRMANPFYLWFDIANVEQRGSTLQKLHYSKLVCIMNLLPPEAKADLVSIVDIYSSDRMNSLMKNPFRRSERAKGNPNHLRHKILI